MALLRGDLTVSATLASCYHHHHKHSLPQTSNHLSPLNKVDFAGFSNCASSSKETLLKWPGLMINSHIPNAQSKRSSMMSRDFNLSTNPVTQELESLLLNALNMNFFERLNLAWKIVFPSATTRQSSNARIAKQRLKMILFSDRCAVSDEAKRKIVDSIVRALSDFVVIESEDKVQLSVSADSDIGTVYSVTVPVRRVKTQYQETEETGTITNIEYRDKGETSGSVDVTFDFYVPE
ncbi:hypothetical protein ACFE04_023498 [Oxalis oulophora]